MTKMIDLVEDRTDRWLLELKLKQARAEISDYRWYKSRGFDGTAALCAKYADEHLHKAIAIWAENVHKS